MYKMTAGLSLRQVGKILCTGRANCSKANHLITRTTAKFAHVFVPRLSTKTPPLALLAQRISLRFSYICHQKLSLAAKLANLVKYTNIFALLTIGQPSSPNKWQNALCDICYVSPV